MRQQASIRFSAAMICLLLMASCAVIAQSSNELSDSDKSRSAAATHLRLIDRLDRPKDGYCIDVLGTGSNMRLDLPVFAHNCKPKLTKDSAVVFDSNGQIVVIAVNRCLTIAGVNSAALPGASVLLRKCGEAGAYFETEKLQRFVHRNDGRLELSGSELCLAVGAKSATTYSTADRWRTLFVDSCVNVESSQSRWEFVSPAR